MSTPTGPPTSAARSARATGASGATPRDDTPPSALTGLSRLTRLFWRLSRRQLLIWFLAVLVTVPASVVAMRGAYPDQAALDARAQLLGNPSAVLMTGPAFALEEYTFWAMVANELFLYILLAAAIMSVLLTVRHTRAEEEAGRLELLRSLPVGRAAPTAAAVVIVGAADLAVGSAVALGALISGGALADSVALGLGTALTGLVFAGITAVIAQLTEHAGTAAGFSLGTLAVAFMLRGIGDVMDPQGSWLSWVSPLAWAQQTRVYVDLRWWPLALTAGVGIMLLVLGALLARRRDLGAGLRAASAGRAGASAALLLPGGLARRLATGSLVVWGTGLFLVAIAFGSLASSLEDLAAEIPAIGEFAPIDLDDLTSSFAGYILMMLSIGPAGLLVAGVLRLRTEEQEGRLAGVLLTGTSRIRSAGAWLLVVTLGSVAVQVLLGLGIGIGVWQATEDSAWIADMTLAALVYLPAIALFGAVAFALYGLRLRWAALAWVLILWAALDTFLGDLLDLPGPLRAFSPLHHVPLVPDADLAPVPLLAMSGLSVMLTLLGLLALRRRDVVAG